MNDYILRAATGDGSVRIFIATAKDTVKKAKEIHHTTPVMTVALGRLLCGVAMMGSMLKNKDDLVTVQINGDGPGGKITATSDSLSQVKACLNNPQVDIPLYDGKQYDVQTAIGFGTITVIKDMGLKEPYVGQIPIMSGEIAEDLTYYFAKSEQTPSAVGLGVCLDDEGEVKQAGGLIIQIMPDANDEIAAKLEENLKKYGNIASILDKGMSPEDILKNIAGEFNPVILDKVPVKYYCNCSRQRVEKALISIGKEEISKILEEDKQATLHCHFCNKDYLFTEDDLIKILKESAR
ncbi:MAG: Hsp33 family molecular chaperone HslO [Lachnospirales bacterium]